MQHQDKECFVFHQHREELVTSAALAKKSQIWLQHKEIDCTKKRTGSKQEGQTNKSWKRVFWFDKFFWNIHSVHVGPQNYIESQAFNKKGHFFEPL